MTLHEFLDSNQRNAWVEHPGFRSLYVRKGPVRVRFPEGSHKVPMALTIANLTAQRPGEGAFTRLLASLPPALGVFVENVDNPLFARKLRSLGFRPTLDSPLCFWKGDLPPEPNGPTTEEFHWGAS